MEIQDLAVTGRVSMTQSSRDRYFQETRRRKSKYGQCAEERVYFWSTKGDVKTCQTHSEGKAESGFGRNEQLDNVGVIIFCLFHLGKRIALQTADDAWASVLNISKHVYF